MALLLAGCACSPAVDVPEPREPVPISPEERDEIRVITYNVQFLPWPARSHNKRPDASYRATRLGREMARFDIVGLNETFDRAPRERLLRELRELWGDSYHVVLHPSPGGLRYSGGLTLASRLPIIDSNIHYYAAYSRPQDYGVMADGWAAKGVLHARIARSRQNQDAFVDVFITHLEAREDAVRPLQIQELVDFVKKHASPAHPIIIMGDMNVDGTGSHQHDSESPYNEMMEILATARTGGGIVDLWPALMGEAHGGTNDQTSIDRGRRIDYIFLCNPVAGGLELEPLHIEVNPYLDDHTGALSDHNAVEAGLRWPRFWDPGIH